MVGMVLCYFILELYRKNNFPNKRYSNLKTEKIVKLVCENVFCIFTY